MKLYWRYQEIKYSCILLFAITLLFDHWGLISFLNFQEYFDTSEMLLPLLGMDKLMTIEAYLCDKSLATTFVK